MIPLASPGTAIEHGNSSGRNEASAAITTSHPNFPLAQAKSTWIAAAKHRLSQTEIPEFEKHACRYAKLLGNLNHAIANGETNRAYHFQDLILHSFSAKLVCIVRQLSTKIPTPYQKACKLAELLNPYAKCDEAVSVQLIAKFPAGYRAVCSFGVKRRALQTLCLDMLTLWHLRPTFDFLQKRRGPEVAADRVRYLVDSKGIKFFVIADIANCFGSFKQEAVRELLPLPRSVTNSCILVTENTHIHISSFGRWKPTSTSLLYLDITTSNGQLSGYATKKKIGSAPQNC